MAQNPRLQALSGLWSRLSRAQKIAIAAVGILAIVLLIVLTRLAPRQDYTTLFSGLSEKDAATIVEKLRDQKIPYELAGGGGTIRVPSKMVYETRLDLASQGLPQGGGVGFEIFNKTNLGATDFTQRLNYQRALEGELSRTINRISAVEQSRVHIVLPQASLYTEKEKPTTASVVLDLRPGVKLEPSQIKGISHLVASSVEGLQPENLTIVDTNGNILADNVLAGENSGLQAQGTQMAMQKDFEQSMEGDLLDMLQRVLGPNRSSVKVSATLDWDQFEANKEIYNPDGQDGLVSSSQEITEESSGEAPSGASGEPGPASNVPSYQQAGGAGTSSSRRTEKTQNFELSKSVERVVRAPGAIKKLSVAVLIDGKLTKSDFDGITSALIAAAGIDSQRGDVLTVKNLPFDRSFYADEKKAMQSSQQMETYISWGKKAAMVIIPLVMLFFLRRLFKPQRSLRKLATTNSMVLDITPHAPLLPPETKLEEKPEEKPEERRRKQLKEQALKVARREPATVAQVVQNWMIEDGEEI